MTITFNFPEKGYAKTSFTIEDKKEFMNIIKEAANVSKNERNNVIKFNIERDQLTVEASDSEVGQFEAILDIHMKGEELKIAMRPFTIKPVEDDSELSLILPVRTY